MSFKQQVNRLKKIVYLYDDISVYARKRKFLKKGYPLFYGVNIFDIGGKNPVPDVKTLF